MKTFFLILALSICNLGFTQTVEEREMDLMTLSWGEKKKEALELLELNKYNRIAIDYLLRSYEENDKMDSIPIFWENLIQNDPNSPFPYLRRVQFYRYEGLSNKEKIQYLNIAFNLDNSNEDVNYLLATLNYEQFINSNSVKLATLTLGYLDNLCSIDGWYKAYLKTPLIQLSNYTGDSEKVERYNSYPDRNSYFPILEFADLIDGWQRDYKYNVFSTHDIENWTSSGIETAQSRINWYSKHLDALEEPVIYDTIPKNIIRFTWLRSFHHPISIRIEVDSNDNIVHWKMSDGAGGYDPGKIIRNDSRKLSDLETETIMSSLDSLDIFNIPTNSSGLIGTDGARWILEVLIDGSYHVVDRWSGGIIEPFCLELLGLTRLIIDEDDIY